MVTRSRRSAAEASGEHEKTATLYRRGQFDEREDMVRFPCHAVKLGQATPADQYKHLSGTGTVTPVGFAHVARAGAVVRNNAQATQATSTMKRLILLVTLLLSGCYYPYGPYGYYGGYPGYYPGYYGAPVYGGAVVVGGGGWYGGGWRGGGWYR